MTDAASELVVPDARSVPRLLPVRIDRVLLDVSHRMAAVALFGLVGTIVCRYLGRDDTPAVAAMAGATVIGLAAAVLTCTRSPRLGLTVVTLAVGVMAGVVAFGLEHAVWALVVSAAAVLAGFILWVATTDPAEATPWREAGGLLAVHLVLAVVAFTLVAVDRADYLHDRVDDLLTPTPVLPSSR